MVVIAPRRTPMQTKGGQRGLGVLPLAWLDDDGSTVDAVILTGAQVQSGVVRPCCP